MYTVVQIIPSLPPKISGVGDYAICLAKQMRQDFGIQTHFLVGDPGWIGDSEIYGFSVSKINQRSANGLCTLLNQHSSSTKILLHYVSYGYAKRGCPSWLVRGLENWKHNNKSKCLLTMFHEISGSGSILKSAFWLSSWQLNLAKSLVMISDSLFTSQKTYADTLRRLSGERQTKIPSLPVFSCIGEPQQITHALVCRNNHLVVFGGKGKRLKVYTQSLDKLRHTCEQFKIEKIIDIGPPIELDLGTIVSPSVQQMGHQAPDVIRKILLNSTVGFLDYNPNLLAKSSIYAAYCAHRLVPVNALSSNCTIDSIVPGKHYWATNLAQLELESKPNIQGIADSAYAWYQDHNLKQQAALFKLCLA